MSSSCKCLFCVSKHDSDSTAEGRFAASALCRRGEEKLLRRSPTKPPNCRSIPSRAEPEVSSTLVSDRTRWERPRSLMASYWPVYRRRRAARLLTRPSFLAEGQTRRLLPTFVLQENLIEEVQFTVRTVPQPGLSQLCGLIRPKEQQQQQQLASFKELIGKSLPG